MSRSAIHLGNLRVLFLLAVGCLIVTAGPSRAQTTLNVTNFGARGDAVQFFANTTSNSVLVTTTTQIPNSAIGDAVEILGAGAPTSGGYSQDMVTSITNVVNGTNIYVKQFCGATLTNAFATYGHDNSPSFQAAINACGADTDDIIDIPAGHYLLLSDNPYGGSYGQNGMMVTNGGIHIVGLGTNSTILIGQGAWTLVGGVVERGSLLVLHPPMINDHFSIGNLTLDGGVQQGNTTNHGYPASTITGAGWDGTHHAVQIGGSGNVVPHMQFTNIVFQHWRGEMAESVDGSTNGQLSIVNCAFTDGNATALNIYPAWDVRSNYFSNLFQIAEYYQAYSSYPSLFAYNVCTNITGNGFAFNGAITNRPMPSFTVLSNVFYFSGPNGFETTPGQNIYLEGNVFIGGTTAIALGVAGYQGSAINSNIVVAFNTFSSCYYAVEVEGAGQNRLDTTLVSSNVFFNVHQIATGYGWSTNVVLTGNIGDASTGPLYSGQLQGQWFWDDPSNQIPPHNLADAGGVTNIVSYSCGMRQKISFAAPASKWFLDDTNAAHMPSGAILQITDGNGNSGVTSTPLYTSSSLLGSPIMLTNGETVNFVWTNGAWFNTTGVTNPPPANPTNHVSVASLPFGIVLTGTAVTNNFTVSNVGGGTLNGTASVSLPFTIVSGGSYNLTSNQSQTITVSFNPASAGNYNQNVTLTGGGGATVAVSGSATNAPVPTPIIQVNPGNIGCGTILVGKSSTNSFTVKNIGTGTLSGTANVASPFNIVSGGSYSLGAGLTQAVMVVFSPTVANNFNQSVTLTGGGGTNVTVSGSATNAPVPTPIIQVNPGNIGYGPVLVGTSATNSFTVKNIGTGTLSGAASVSSPFRIASGSNYNLGAGQTQAVMVLFSPLVASNYNQSVTFTGGGGTNTTVTGNATNLPPLLPAVSAISINATAIDTNAPGVQIYPGTIVQLSATATNALTWQWSYAVNGGSPVVYTNGTTPITNISLYYDTNTIGNSYLWTLVVSNGQAWAESQTNFGVEEIAQGPAFAVASGTLSHWLTSSTLINGLPTSYIYQPLPSIGGASVGTAVYNFTVANAGNYEVQALVNAPNANANSFYVNIDGQPKNSTMIWDIMPITSGFEQRIVSWRGTGSENNDQIVPKIFNLSAGPHQIIFMGREPYTALASFTLLQLVPSNQSPQAAPGNLRVVY